MARQHPATPELTPELTDALESDGHVELGTFSLLSLDAAGARSSRRTPGDAGVVGDEAPTPGSEQGLALIAVVTNLPLAAGSWLLSPPWFMPEDAGDRDTQLTLFQTDQGTPVLLLMQEAGRDRRCELASLEWAATSFTETLFAPAPPAPEDTSGAWSTPEAGSSGVLGLMWSPGRFQCEPPREKLLVMRATAQSTAANIGWERNFAKRLESGGEASRERVVEVMLETLQRPLPTRTH